MRDEETKRRRDGVEEVRRCVDSFSDLSVLAQDDARNTESFPPHSVSSSLRLSVSSRPSVSSAPAFTLIEMITVISIIVIVLALVVPVVSSGLGGRNIE